MPQLKSQRDEPGTLREYETIYILRPEATSEQLQAVNDRVRKIIEDRGSKVLRLDNWGKRKLAYEINKSLKGIYLYWLYLADADLIYEIERNLRMLDVVIRFYTVRVDENVDPEARPSDLDDEAYMAAATVVPDEEDAYMGRTHEDDGEEKPAEEKAEKKPAEDKAEEKPAEEKPAEEKPAEEKPAATDKPEA